MRRNPQRSTRLVARKRAPKTLSQQPRFAQDARAFYASVYRWVNEAAIEEPPYATMSRTRDAWLADFWRREPHLAGVLNSVVLIDSNRAWKLVGGRNQVYRYTDVLHNWQYTPSLAGWRHGMKAAALSYYTTDINAIVEVGREGEPKYNEGTGEWSVTPLRAMYHTDPTLCQLTGETRTPLEYNPGSGQTQHWGPWDFMRLASMPAIQEQYRGLGFCAVSRCLELAKLMIAVYQHDEEQLGARMPKGLLLLHNISEDQWRTAMEARDTELTGMERKYFGGVAVLASSGMDQVAANLVALSSLPQGFDLRVFTDLLMFGYALAFGRDAREFWPVSSGALGTGTETEVMATKASGKGEIDFTLTLQEQLSAPRNLPPTLQFEFAQRDTGAELVDANVATAWATAINTMAAPSGMGLPSTLTDAEKRQLLAQQGLIPEGWTVEEEEVTATDTAAAAGDTSTPGEARQLRERYLSLSRVQRAIERFPDEPIIEYTGPVGRERVLWRRGGDAIRRYWQVERAAGGQVLFQAPDGTVITEGDVAAAFAAGDARLPEIAGIWQAKTT